MKLQELNDTLQVYAHNGMAQDELVFVVPGNDFLDIESIKVEKGVLKIKLEPFN